MNIIIPIGGIGERFNKEGYFYPKPLINFLGKPLIFWLIDNLNLKENTEIHIPYNQTIPKVKYSLL
jgi:GTP:adenosylcobinamide-phosphate guanylyltransferase